MRFGGTFETDFGKGRYLQCDQHHPETPAESGCYLAYGGFVANLSVVDFYLAFRPPDTPPFHNPDSKLHVILDELNPRLFTNNLLVPYFVAILEEYLEATFIALLRYSKSRSQLFRNIRLPADALERVATDSSSLEEEVANTLSFQNVHRFCHNFHMLDKRLDIAGALRKPYRRRKVSLFDTTVRLIEIRHKLIHGGQFDSRFTDAQIRSMALDLEEVVDRIYRTITQRYGWEYRGERIFRMDRRKTSISGRSESRT